MGWFGRRTKDETPDGALPMFTVEQAARFISAAQRAFAEAGMETVLQGGVLRTADGGTALLHSVATVAADVPEREWPELLARHAGVMVPALQKGAFDARSVRDDQVFLRVLERDAVPGELEAWDEVAGDLVAVLGIDYPDHVETFVGGRPVAELGGWASVRETGLRNLRALTADESREHALEGGGTIHVSTGGYFHASRLLVLAEVLAADFRIERPGHGVLVAVPNRSTIAVHPIEDLSVISVMQTMLGLAADQSRRPGGLSQEVFFWQDGLIEQVTRRSEDGSVAVMATGRFGEVLNELDLG